MVNETAASNSTAELSRSCKTDRSSEEFELNVSNRSDVTTEVNRKTLNYTNYTTGYSSNEDALGLLVIEPFRNVSHSVQHHPCESPAIQQALVTRIMNSQDLERNRDFFLYSEKVFHSLLRQRDHFEMRID